MRTLSTQRLASKRAAFTLVELLVVITIIGILAALLVAAVGPALGRANEARIRGEMTGLDGALKDYKTVLGSFPPNAQTDGSGTLNENVILSNMKRHLKKAFPNHREPDQLIAALVGLSGTTDPTAVASLGEASNLPGGMTAAEALVFWTGGFSDDPKYPISGPGGPSYSIPDVNNSTNHEIDPIENRSWRIDINTPNLGPRGEDNFFPSAYTRFINYTDPRDTTGSNYRRINFWVLKAPNSQSPYLYFDASRGAGVTTANDAPAAGPDVDHSDAGDMEESLNELAAVYAIKTRSTDSSAANPFLFANDKKFQILHCGVDGDWLDLSGNGTPYFDGTTLQPQELVFPNGPWGPEQVDTLTNFTDGNLGDAQP